MNVVSTGPLANSRAKPTRRVPLKEVKYPPIRILPTLVSVEG